MKLYQLVYLAAGLAVFVSSPALCADSLIEGFEYKSVAQFEQKWRVLSSGFTKELGVNLISGNVKEGKKALQLDVPSARDTSGARIDLDITPSVDFKDFKQLVLWVYLENPEVIAQTGVHIGDSDWDNYFAKFGYIQPVKGWQEVMVSRESFVVGNGNPSWGSVVQTRLTFWFNPGASASKIIIDKTQWNNRKYRSQILNTNWYQ